MDFPTTNMIGDMIRTLIPNTTLAYLVNGVLAVLALLMIPFVLVPFLIYLERKVCARIQARVGPNRVGPFGLLQTIADVMKLLFKEILIPGGADKFTFLLATTLPLSSSFLILAIMPFDSNLQVTDLSMGVPFVIAISGLGILGLLIGGWGSNNKYSLLGSLRAGSQMISYEISLALIMLFIVLVSGTASLREIVLTQQGPFWHSWWIFKIPVLGLVVFILYLISSTAELNRGPFDIAEAEQELTAGPFTEYSGMAYAMFYLAEYINLVIAAGLAATLFLGGFLPPLIGVQSVDQILVKVPGVVWFALKDLFIIIVYMFFRWTFPRPRVDQLIAFEWKFMLPLNLIMLVLGAVFVSVGWILP